MKVKTERYANLLLKEINDILYTEIRDEDIVGTTATYVRLADDLSYAKVYFTTIDDREKVIKDLNNASGFFRSLLADRLKIRHTPELKFIFDESIEYAQNIENIIKEIHEKDN